MSVGTGLGLIGCQLGSLVDGHVVGSHNISAFMLIHPHGPVEAGCWVGHVPWHLHRGLPSHTLVFAATFNAPILLQLVTRTAQVSTWVMGREGWLRRCADVIDSMWPLISL